MVEEIKGFPFGKVWFDNGNLTSQDSKEGLVHFTALIVSTWEHLRDEGVTIEDFFALYTEHLIGVGLHPYRSLHPAAETLEGLPKFDTPENGFICYLDGVRFCDDIVAVANQQETSIEDHFEYPTAAERELLFGPMKLLDSD